MGSTRPYKYKDAGKILFQLSSSRDICIVTEPKDSNTIKYKYRKTEKQQL